jgi:predicted nucleic acid-binding protein
MLAVARRALRAPGERLVIPAPVTAEFDYLLGKHAGYEARLRFLGDLGAGNFEVACVEPADYPAIDRLATRYRDLRPGLADLAVVVIAARLGTRRILTWDKRRFRVMQPLQGGSFTLLPWDEA